MCSCGQPGGVAGWTAPQRHSRLHVASREAGEMSKLVQQPVKVEQVEILRIELLGLLVHGSREQPRRVQRNRLCARPHGCGEMSARQVGVRDQVHVVGVARRWRRLTGRPRAAGWRSNHRSADGRGEGGEQEHRGRSEADLPQRSRCTVAGQ